MAEKKNRINFGPIKFGQKEHMEDLFNYGHMYMNPLRHFIAQEKNDFRGDVNEGNAASFQASKVRVKLGPFPDGKIIEFGKEEGLLGQVHLRFHETEDLPVYCMYLLVGYDGKIEVDDRIEKFGEWAVAIVNHKEFGDRIRRAIAKEKLAMESKMVEYVNPLSHHGEMGVFKKHLEYSYQNEFRFMLHNRKGPYSLNIGPINDISVLMTTEEFFRPMKENSTKSTYDHL